MSVELIGFISIALSLICVIRGTQACVFLFQISLIFGAAAGVILTSFGGANLAPAHLVLGFLVLSVVNRPNELRAAIQSLDPNEAGFWLVLTIAIGVLSAVFLPRIFMGQTEVITVTRGSSGPGLTRVPLAPVSGNITQTIYIVGDLVAYLALSSYAASRQGLNAMAKTVLVAAALNLVFAVLDYATYLTNTADLLSFMRNATYRMLDDTEVAGFKRLVGSYPEASTFSYATAGFFAFTARLWIAQRFTIVTGLLALGSMIALALSTSTTGYATLATCLVVLYFGGLRGLLSAQASTSAVCMVILGPIIAACVVFAVQIDQTLWSIIVDLFNKVILDKTTSNSGLERASWNLQAWTNFLQTYGLGVGVGSVRASSFLIAVPASIGVLGALSYAGFLAHVLLRPFRSAATALETDIMRAGRLACFAQFIAGVYAGTFIDLGLPFFVFAVLATSRAGSRLFTPAGYSPRIYPALNVPSIGQA